MVSSCGRVQTGTFLEGAAPNGLIGLGIEDIAVPTILAKNGFTSNSFSMCFGQDGVGRIRFGDNGTADQSETPFNLRQSQSVLQCFLYIRTWLNNLNL